VVAFSIHSALSIAISVTTDVFFIVDLVLNFFTGMAAVTHAQSTNNVARCGLAVTMATNVCGQATLTATGASSWTARRRGCTTSRYGLWLGLRSGLHFTLGRGVAIALHTNVPVQTWFAIDAVACVPWGIISAITSNDQHQVWHVIYS
jgi:hypothetical protein